MSELSEFVLKKREYELKLIQAWSDGRSRIANIALIGNAAGLATALAFIKDKGHDEPSVRALNGCTLGMAFAFLALLLTWLITETAIDTAFKATGDEPNKTIISLSHPSVSVAFMALIFISLVGLGYGLAFFEGWSQATIDIKNGLLLKK